MGLLRPARGVPVPAFEAVEVVTGKPVRLVMPAGCKSGYPLSTPGGDREHAPEGLPMTPTNVHSKQPYNLLHVKWLLRLPQLQPPAGKGFLQICRKGCYIEGCTAYNLGIPFSRGGMVVQASRSDLMDDFGLMGLGSIADKAGAKKLMLRIQEVIEGVGGGFSPDCKLRFVKQSALAGLPAGPWV